MRLGYACQNLTLPATTNHTVRLASLARVRPAVEQNLVDLEQMIRWNAAQGLGLLRVGQSMVPFASHEAFPYDWRASHGAALGRVGEVARELGLRLSQHPGQYIQPGSRDPGVVARSLAELRYSCALLDLLGAVEGVMVLHLGGAYGDHDVTRRRFVEVLQGEPDLLRRLVLEHDEKVWTFPQVLEAASALGVPVVVDNLHHRLNPGGVTLAEALRLARPTWAGRSQKVHLSSQKVGAALGAHADFIDPADLQSLLEAWGSDDPLDVMVEAKAKDRAALALLPPRRAL